MKIPDRAHGAHDSNEREGSGQDERRSDVVRVDQRPAATDEADSALPADFPPRARRSAALQRLLQVPAMGIGTLPTPLDTHLLHGQTLFVKRDDRIGYGRGGIKARKIDYLVRHLLDHEHGSLVTVATNVTNLVHDIVPLLAAHNIPWRIFVSDDPPLPMSKRRQLFADIAVDGLDFVDRSRVGMTLAALTAAARLSALGKRPMAVLPSFGHPAAVIGVARGYVEAMQQVISTSGQLPRSLFITAASGVSLAGIVLGERLMRDSGYPRVRIVGVRVYSGPTREYIRLLLSWTARRLAIRKGVGLKELELTDWERVGDFGYFDDEIADLCRRVQHTHGLTIDPIYGGKTWKLMESMTLQDPALLPTVYWHCGYTPDWENLRSQC